MAKTKTVTSRPHPQYIEYSIYSYPIAGQFYQVQKKDTLTKIAKRAYGSGTLKWWSIINLSAYNSQFTRRKKSTKCKAPLREYPEGYLALCPPYPIIWIPPKEGGEPRPGMTPKKVPKQSPIGPIVGPLIKPNATIKAKQFPATVKSALRPSRTPAGASTATVAAVAAATTTKVREGLYQAPSKEETGGISDWIGPILLIGGIGIVGIAFAARQGAGK